LKLYGQAIPERSVCVAPRAGAWVETVMIVVPICCFELVAPRAGAWVETGITAKIQARCLVAPRAGAWVETMNWKANV